MNSLLFLSRFGHKIFGQFRGTDDDARALDLLRLFRLFAATCQAQVFARWSRDPSADADARRGRLAQAQTFLVTAENIIPSLKTKAPEVALRLARAEIAAAKESLDNLQSASGRGHPPPSAEKK